MSAADWIFWAFLLPLAATLAFAAAPLVRAIILAGLLLLLPAALLFDWLGGFLFDQAEKEKANKYQGSECEDIFHI